MTERRNCKTPRHKCNTCDPRSGRQSVRDTESLPYDSGRRVEPRRSRADTDSSLVSECKTEQVDSREYSRANELDSGQVALESW